MDSKLGYLFIVLGVIGLLGSLVAGYANLTIGEAMSMVASQEAPPGTDISALQESAASLGVIITIAWIWIIAALGSSIVSIYFGYLTVKDRLNISRK